MKTERYLNIVLAVLSVASLALRVVTGVAQQLRAFFIVVMAVANVAKPYPPFAARLRPIVDFKTEVLRILSEAEGLWFKVHTGQLDDQQIDQGMVEIRTRKVELEVVHFRHGSLPVNEKILKKASLLAEQYLKTHYPVLDPKDGKAQAITGGPQ